MIKGDIGTMEEEARSKLEKACDEYMEFLRSEEYHEDKANDYAHYIFEAALEHYYGKDVWDEINARYKGI